METSDDGFELLASSLRADNRDLKSFVEALASKLEGGLPDQTSVERKGSMFGGEKRVRRITLELGDDRYLLEADGGRVNATYARAVRGIVLKTERLALDEWIERLSRQLAEQARSSEQSRLALERLLS